FCVFFFEAEDGIRDFLVTGVQTCALPISEGVQRGDGAALFRRQEQKGVVEARAAACGYLLAVFVRSHGVRARLRRDAAYGMRDRSEERRVGKECRSRWARDAYKKIAGGRW